MRTLDEIRAQYSALTPESGALDAETALRLARNPCAGQVARALADEVLMLRRELATHRTAATTGGPPPPVTREWGGVDLDPPETAATGPRAPIGPTASNAHLEEG